MSTTVLQLPATNNTLDHEQRSRLLRSTRKLEAVLGTAPQFIESTEPAPLPAIRRRLYASPSASSSRSSFDSTEPEYVLVKPGVRSSPYQISPNPSINGSSPGSSRTSSPVRKPRNEIPAAAPISVALDITATTVEGARKKKGPMPIAQPLLLRFRSQAASAKDASSSSSATPPPPPPKSIFDRRKGKVDSAIGPLSPINASFSTNAAGASAEPKTPTTPTSTSGGPMTDREKRRKMAKLMRTLGENIPPELVFGKRAEDAAGEEVQPVLAVKPTRRSSLSLNRTRAKDLFTSTSSHKASKSIAAPSPNAVGSVLSVAENPMPPPTVIVEEPEKEKEMSRVKKAAPTKPVSEEDSAPKRRSHRPRSLTLGSASAFVAANQKLLQREQAATAPASQQEAPTNQRTTKSLDSPRSSSIKRKGAQAQAVRVSQSPFASVAATPAQGSLQVPNGRSTTKGGDNDVESGRRKEKEWSGEWNVKDMEAVARTLRGLRA